MLRSFSLVRGATTETLFRAPSTREPWQFLLNASAATQLLAERFGSLIWLSETEWNTDLKWIMSAARVLMTQTRRRFPESFKPEG